MYTVMYREKKISCPDLATLNRWYESKRITEKTVVIVESTNSQKTVADLLSIKQYVPNMETTSYTASASGNDWTMKAMIAGGVAVIAAIIFIIARYQG